MGGTVALRDISLHILDLIENSIRADASIVAVTVEEDPARDVLRVAVEDNGPGIGQPAEVATDPFFTTKVGKKTGLGLSLFKGAAERANGWLVIGRSSLGGTAVEAEMGLNHVDRSPLGDLAETISSVVCTNPLLDLRFRLRVGERTFDLKVADLAKGHRSGGGYGLSLAREVYEKIKQGMESLEVRT